MFSKPVTFFTKSENDTLLECVRQNESGTSGEIRIFVEGKCEYVNPIERAQKLFVQYKMYETEHRNAVLIYIAYRDQDFAILGDKEIFAKAPSDFWQVESKRLARAFREENYLGGLMECIQAVGNMLTIHFPFHGENRNELPDELIFGKK